MRLCRRSSVLLALAVVVLALPGCASDGADDDPAGGPTEAAPPATETEQSGPGTTTARQEERSGPGTTTAPQEEPRRLRLDPVASGLEDPVHVAAAPGEPERLYVVEQEGRLRLIEGGRVRPEPFLDIRDDVTSGGEQGLFSVAFHPDYGENGRLYVDYTNRDGDTRVVEYRANDERTRVAEGTRRVLLALEQPFPNHNGGQLAFGPDGRLYVGMGDGGGGGDPDNRAQDLSDPLGKLLRIDVDAPGARWEIAAYGLRNPWRFSFDRGNGDLYLGDVGQGAFEEVDYLPRSQRGLVNFGWDVFEGNARYEDKTPNPAGRLVMPVATYPLEGDTCSVVGGFAYRGEAIPGLEGRYFYGDYCSGSVWSLRIAGGKATEKRRERFTVDLLTSFGEDVRGELYLVSHAGTIYRLAS